MADKAKPIPKPPAKCRPDRKHILTFTIKPHSVPDVKWPYFTLDIKFPHPHWAKAYSEFSARQPHHQRHGTTAQQDAQDPLVVHQPLPGTVQKVEIKKLQGGPDAPVGLFLVFNQSESAKEWFKMSRLFTKGDDDSGAEVYMQMEVTHDRVDAELKIWE
ncbi:hypothetical protein Daus18300_003451 [Diaporthe australafricana]|uniref:Glyoxalase-like domain-containing protein n=1 Tax=Diaporthe australafricana TaxID=127596 RepID=A0ABR3XEQ3_9PEZI